MLEKFEAGEHKVYLASNRFVINDAAARNQTTSAALAEDTPELKHRWDYIYEPDAKELLDGLMQRYIESLVYQAVIENIACEQAAKMIAMKMLQKMPAPSSTNYNLFTTMLQRQLLRNFLKLSAELQHYKNY